jgi:hypothetical protein
MRLIFQHFLSTFEAVVPVIHSCFPFQDHYPNKQFARFPSVGATKFHTNTKQQAKL